MTTRRNFPGSNMHNSDWDNNQDQNQNFNDDYGQQNRFQQQRYQGPQNSLDLGRRSLYDNQKQGWGGNQFTGQGGYNSPDNYESRGASGRYYNSNRNDFEQGYGSRQHNMPTNRYSQRERDNDNDFFDRAGETLRAGWNQLTGGDHNNERNYNRGSNYGPYDYGMSSFRGNYGSNRNDDRNFFERAGDRIREGWNDLRSEWNDDRNRFRQEGRDFDSYSPGRPTNENREYRMGPTSEHDYERNMNRRRYNRNDNWEL